MVGWGSAVGDAQIRERYIVGACNVRLCRYLANKYGVVPFGPEASKWGTLPDKYKAGWWQYRSPVLQGLRGGTCDQIVGG